MASAAIKPEELKDFELKFYNAMGMFGDTIARIMDVEVTSCKVERKGDELKVVLIINTKTNEELATTKLLREIRKINTHFVVFYTPAHYRPQPLFTIDKVKYKDEIKVVGRLCDKII